MTKRKATLPEVDDSVMGKTAEPVAQKMAVVDLPRGVSSGVRLNALSRKDKVVFVRRDAHLAGGDGIVRLRRTPGGQLQVDGFGFSLIDLPAYEGGGEPAEVV